MTPACLHRVRTILCLAILALGAAGAQAQPAGVGAAAPPADRWTLVHAGTLLAVPGEQPRREMTVVVKNDRIAAVLPGYIPRPPEAPADAQVRIVDLKDRFVLPGLMDAHVHLDDEPSFSRRRVERGDRKPASAAEKTVNAVVYARRALAAGFTTVRDLGSDDQSVFAVRNAINQGRIIGPRILVAGSAIAVTGGHGDGTPIHAAADRAARIAEGTCDGADECRSAVRHMYKLGADVIKFTATGGFGSNTGLDPQLFPDEVKAIIDTAHLVGLKVAAHAYSPVAIKEAVRAGVDSIEHGFLLDDEGIQLMKKNGTFLVPTLSAAYPPPIFRIPNPESVQIRNQYRAFERAMAAGVKIAFGSDVGTFSHGTSAKEFGYMVQYGMSPVDAIRAATRSTAELFGLEAEVGTLEPGKVADLVAVTRDPLADIAALMDVDFVMKSGRVAKQGGAMTEPFTYP
jgi:imidazolonepropionase-like amidohydrolase